METYKLFIEYCAQVDPILHILPEYFGNTEQAVLGSAVWSEFPQFVRAVAAAESAEQAMCCLTRVPF